MKLASLCPRREALFVEAFQASNDCCHRNPGNVASLLPRAMLSLPFRRPHSSLFTFHFSLFLLLLCACGEERTDYRLAVPAEAVAVCEVDVSELVGHAAASLHPLATMAEELGGEELRGKVEKLIANPSLLGLDFGEPAFLFIMPDERIGMAMKVDDENLLTDLLTYLANERICRALEQESGYQRTSVMDLVEVAYDGSTLLLTVAPSPRSTSQFISQRMAGEEALFGVHNSANEPLMLCLTASEEGTFALSAEHIDGPALLAQLYRLPRIKEALRMAEAVVDAEAIIRALDGPLHISVNEAGWRMEAGLGNSDFLSEMDDWADAAERYGCAIRTLSENHFELCTPAGNWLLSVEDNTLSLSPAP